MPVVKAMFPEDVVSITPYAKQGGDSRTRQIYRESTRSFIRNEILEVTLLSDNIKHANIVLQGVEAPQRDTLSGQILEAVRANMTDVFPVDISAAVAASQVCTPTRSTR